MNEDFESVAKSILDHLDATPRGIALDEIKRILKKDESVEHVENPEHLINDAIQYALTNWLVEKVIDYPRYKDGFAIGAPTWVLKKLTGEESKCLQELPEVKTAYLRLLQSCSESDEIGRMREKDALKHLQELGFDVDRIPHIPGRTQLTLQHEDGEWVTVCRLIPEFEKTEEFKQMIRELEEKEMRKLDRYF